MKLEDMCCSLLRAWHKEQELILTVESIDFVATLEEESTVGYISFKEGIAGYSEEIQGHQRTETDYACPLSDVILMKYIGIKDIRNIPIYESDIVKTIWQNCGVTNWEFEFVGEIFYSIEHCAFRIRSLNEHYSRPFYNHLNEKLLSIEVIGNIYETPNLLKGNSNET